MKLSETAAFERLASHDHGVLSTVHADRGVDAVPVVYVVVGEAVGIPIDRVKSKSSMRLQREKNLEADPRATLLIEQWDRDDWSKLWWVRAELRYQSEAPNSHTPALSARLAERFVQYRDEPFAGMLVLGIVAVSGWEAKHA